MRLLFSIVVICMTCGAVLAQNSDGLKLNDIQIIGSHNSYKQVPDPRVIKFLLKFKKQLGKSNDPIGLDYGHLPFDSQFTDYHMRGLEIDIHNDPKGGAFYKRRINALIHGMHQKSGLEALRKPGFKVLHIKDVDYLTNYLTFIDALTALKKWSDEHPNHLPIFINLETKTGAPADASGILRFLEFKREVPYDSTTCDALDAEIKSVFGNDLKSVLTPDRLRGKYATLDEMATHHGWPTLDKSRGKIIFILLGDTKKLYLDKHPSATGRAMCVYSHPGNAECAFIMQDDPVADSSRIPVLVKQGYIVRTRSDAETVQSRNNDTTARTAAFKSGAQIISTDYYKPDLRFSDFTVQWDKFGIHAGRVNPVLFPARSKEWLKE